MADSSWWSRTKRETMAEERFSFEDLEVWQEAVDFAEKCLDVAERIERDRRRSRLLDQLESAATSPALNIAEGKGRFSKREFVQFLFIARGSLFETVTLLVIFRRRKWIGQSDFGALRKDAVRLGKRISSLINAVRSEPK
jgi:four helix bundle protein